MAFHLLLPRNFFPSARIKIWKIYLRASIAANARKRSLRKSEELFRGVRLSRRCRRTIIFSTKQKINLPRRLRKGDWVRIGDQSIILIDNRLIAQLILMNCLDLRQPCYTGDALSRARVRCDFTFNKNNSGKNLIFSFNYLNYNIRIGGRIRSAIWYNFKLSIAVSAIISWQNLMTPF